jgi:hypothetical protein
MVTLHTRPDGSQRQRLALAPALESWNKSSDPGQVRKNRYLEHVVAMAEPLMVDDIPLALDLTVGVPEGQPLMVERDLDNYLRPVVAKLGQARFVAAFGSKRHQDHSTLTVAPAEPAESTRDPDLQITPTVPYDPPVPWRREIIAACERVEGLDPQGTSAVHLTIAFELGPGRNWTALWKPTIDGLGPLLGTDRTPWRSLDDPRDGRVTDLFLHRTIDATRGWTVGIGFWWSILASQE